MSHFEITTEGRRQPRAPGFGRYEKRSTSLLAAHSVKAVERRHTYGEFHLKVQADTSVPCSAASDESIGVHPSFTSSSLPNYHNRNPHQQQQKPAGDVHVEVANSEFDNGTGLTPITNTRKETEGAFIAQSSEVQPSTRSDVELLQRRVSVEVPGSEHTQIVVEVHPAMHNDQLKFLAERDSVSASGIRSSAPELRMVTSTAFDEHAARTTEPRRKRQFVVVAVADDVKRLTTHAGVHTASGVRRSESCTLPADVRSPMTSRRFVISLMNLDTGRFSSSSVLPQCRPSLPSSSQPVSSTVASGCLSERTASVTVALEASSSPRCALTSDCNLREASNELWSLRALLAANHENISMDESFDEATTEATATTATTPQSADDVSVKSSADTVVGVDDRPSTAAAQPPATTTVTTAVADPQPPSVAEASASSGDDGITRKPSIRRQNYREAIARRQNHRIQTNSNELSIPTSSLEASSEPTDTESSMSFECCTYTGSLASSNDTTASSFGDSQTSTDSTAGGSGSDGHGGGHRLEQLRGDSGYRSLEAQQSLGQVREFRRQSASHFFLDSSTNVIYEDQMTTTTTTTSSDDVQTSASPTSVVSVQQMQYSTAAGVSIPMSLSTPDTAASGSANNMRSEHRQNKAAQRKRIQYRCDRQAVEIHDSVAVGDPVEYKVTHQSHHRHHHHHHHHHHQPHQQQQQPHRHNTDGDNAAENMPQRVSVGTATTTTTTTTTKPSLFSRLLRTTHVGSGSSSAGGSGVASSRNSLVRIQRDYSIDERSNAIFNEFLRHDPTYDTKHTLSVHARSSRAARRSRVPRSPTSARGGRRRLAVEEQASSTLTAAETLPVEGNGQLLRDYASHTAPYTSTTSPLLNRKHFLVDAFSDPRVSSSLVGRSMLRDGRRRSEGSSRLTTDVTAATIHATGNDKRRASTCAEQSTSDNRQLSDTEQTASSESPTNRDLDDASADAGDVRQPHMSTTSQHTCQRRSGATSHRIPVIQLTTDEDTLQ